MISHIRPSHEKRSILELYPLCHTESMTRSPGPKRNQRSIHWQCYFTHPCITRLLGQTTIRCNFLRVTVYIYSRWHDKRRKWRNTDSSCHLVDRIRYGFGPLKATRKVAQTKIYGKMVPLSRNEDEKIYENPEDV